MTIKIIQLTSQEAVAFNRFCKVALEMPQDRFEIKSQAQSLVSSGRVLWKKVGDVFEGVQQHCQIFQRENRDFSSLVARRTLSQSSVDLDSLTQLKEQIGQYKCSVLSCTQAVIGRQKSLEKQASNLYQKTSEHILTLSKDSNRLKIRSHLVAIGRDFGIVCKQKSHVTSLQRSLDGLQSLVEKVIQCVDHVGIEGQFIVKEVERLVTSSISDVEFRDSLKNVFARNKKVLRGVTKFLQELKACK